MPIDIPYPEEQIPSLVNAIALNAPATVGDKLYVQVPSFASNDRIEANWEPHGGTYPTAGTQCLIGFDQANHAWVLSWIGGWS